MLELSTDEYAIIIQPLMQAANYFKPNTELGKQLAQVTEMLKKRAKGSGVPVGGSSSGGNNKTKDQKIKDLLQTFGIDKRLD